MLVALAITASAVLAQADRPIIPELPDPPEGVDQTTYIVTLNGQEMVGFLEERSRTQLMFYPDTPWSVWPMGNGSKPLVSSRVGRDEESPARRKLRHENEFAAHNYTLVDGYWIPNEIAQPARRAHEMYAATREKLETRFTPSEAEIETITSAAPASATAPSPASRWGAHVLIALAALVAMGVIARFTFLANR